MSKLLYIDRWHSTHESLTHRFRLSRFVRIVFRRFSFLPEIDKNSFRPECKKCPGPRPEWKIFPQKGVKMTPAVCVFVSCLGAGLGFLTLDCVPLSLTTWCEMQRHNELLTLNVAQCGHSI